MGKPINVGDSFTRTYYRYNPVVVNGEPTSAPNKQSPLNLTELTAVFVVKVDGREHEFSGAGKVVVTPLQGKIEVNLLPADTEKFPPNRDAYTYLRFSDGKTIGRQTTKILPRELAK